MRMKADGTMDAGVSLLLPRARVGLLSLVIPVYNEECVLPLLREKLTCFVDGLDCPVEVVLVDDGSRDGSLTLLRSWAEVDKRVLVLALARNFGHQTAVTAGLDIAGGDAVVTLDADLQDPPEVVHAMLEKYLEGFDVVYGQRVSRQGETAFKRLTAWLFYRLMRQVGSIDLLPDTGDFRLMSRRVVDALGAMRESHRFLRGMVHWTGFAQTVVRYVRPPRAGGETKYPLLKMLSFAMDGLVSFSTLPLKLSLYGGLLVLLAAFGYVVWALLQRFVFHAAVPGWTSLVALVCLLNGATLLSVGLIGTYLSRVFEEAKRRPLYLVAAKFQAAGTEKRESGNER